MSDRPRVPKVMCVAGARPNFMKVAPVLRALDQRDIPRSLVHTGQHYDHGMSRVFFDELDLPEPDHFLGCGGGTHGEQTANVIVRIEEVVAAERPDVVVVAGDVNSTLAAAVVGAKSGAYVAHVEAGLRSGDWTMPEEVNRVAVDRLSDLLYAPSKDGVANLEAEGFRVDQIEFVGNVMADTLLRHIDRARDGDVLERLGLTSNDFCLVTLHRPANVDDPATMRGLLDLLAEVSERVPVVWPVHPRVRALLPEHDLAAIGATLLDPLGYLDFVALEADATVALTDSGGVQEETTILGTPCITLRTNTERPVTVDHGTNVLVGRDPALTLAALDRALVATPTTERPELWDGHAGERIADSIVRACAAPRLRPTDHLQDPRWSHLT